MFWEKEGIKQEIIYGSMTRIKAIDKKKCQYTGKTVAIYERTQAGFDL